jgi:tyrosyl-tRNA synthetase
MTTVRFITVATEVDTIGIGIDLAEQCVVVGFAKTKSEARRLITQGGIRLADRVVKDPFARLAHDHNEWILVEKVA